MNKKAFFEAMSWWNSVSAFATQGADRELPEALHLALRRLLDDVDEARQAVFGAGEALILEELVEQADADGRCLAELRFGHARNAKQQLVGLLAHLARGAAIVGAKFKPFGPRSLRFVLLRIVGQPVDGCECLYYFCGRC